MPLGERAGFEKSQSRYRGVETAFNDNMPQLLNFNLSTGAFDFVVAPLMNPSYRPSLLEKDGVLPFAASDLVLSPSPWSSHVVGKISSWIDLDSEDETLRMDSETTLKQEIAWANHLSIQACILPSPKGASCANYARCVNQILLGLNNMQAPFVIQIYFPIIFFPFLFSFIVAVLILITSLLKLWLRILLVKTDDDDVMDANSTSFIDSWELWNAFCLLCEHHSQLFVALNILSSLPSVNSLGCWFGEPVTAAIINMDVSIFWFPCDLLHAAPMMMRVLNGAIFNLPVFPSKWTGLSMPVKVPSKADYWVLLPFNTVCYFLLLYINFPYSELSFRCFTVVVLMDDLVCKDIPSGHIWTVLVISSKVWIPFLSKNVELGYRDFLQSPLQPLMDNLEAQTYETFERDSKKYIQYQRAISKALLDRVPDEEASAVCKLPFAFPNPILVLMVVGAGHGPLVRASLQATEETGHKLKVYPVEKNPHAVVTLHSLVKLEGWEDIVTKISCDMRCWDAPEKADILVSELLGSLGDNELSPECLDGAQRFLKQDGISISSSYVKSHKDLVHFETAYVVKLHNVARLAPSQTVFTFTHPDYSTKKSIQRYKRLQFEIACDTGSAMVHGMFAIFFPPKTPVCMKPGSPLEVHFWRCCGSSKVWCEWCVTSPDSSAIHNISGRSYWVGL
ncbi:hypothetical protein POTOM_012958 [Populus tomentosa]|uniref:Protein arginine N-methyltransferase n=1 Tax=Populus tomentosa TaxID=118781 RepID=A0A8X8A864_POPTO|nr:hypothetical protein POTOM_012958 [Populus tomentosa]